MADSPARRTVRVDVEPEIHAALSAKATEGGVSLAAVVRQCIELVLEWDANPDNAVATSSTAHVPTAIEKATPRRTGTGQLVLPRGRTMGPTAGLLDPRRT